MEVGYKIKSLREQKGWSQRELANRVGINFSVMNRIEKDERKIYDEEIVKIASVLDCTTDYLLGRSNYPTLDQNSSDFADKHGIFESKDEEREFSMDYESWTEEEKEEMREFVRFKMEQRKKKQQKSDK